jgi:hypothetical protein
MASALFACGQLTEAMAQYSSTAALYTQLQLQLPDMAEQLLEHGDLCQQLGMHQEAGTLFQEALQVLDTMACSLGVQEMQVSCVAGPWCTCCNHLLHGDGEGMLYMPHIASTEHQSSNCM